ncbi:hypothetical protein SDC9_206940 [bioreactor metagenome]|uniref:Uncharacterized protein n=1 Tax=bioreactor metagenome TaxID=1076179 RepID=A0A645J933_9ZZZZ
MIGLGNHEFLIENFQFFVFDVFSQNLEAFAASGFNHRGEEHAVDNPFVSGTALSDEFHEFAYIIVFSFSAEFVTPFFNDLVNHLKMFQLFLRNRQKFAHDFRIFGKHRDQCDGVGGSFLFAPCVVGEDF